MKNCLFYIVVLVSLLGAVTATAQVQPATDTTELWTIITADGNEYVGVILEEDSIALKLETKTLGIITIPIEIITHREQIKQENIVADEFWFDNPQATRYFWGPNGYGLRQGEGYYQNIWVFVNQVSYGFSDNFTVGAGMVPTFLFGDASEFMPLWFTPKFSLPVVDDKVNVGAGALLITIIGEREFVALPYASFTYGSRNSNASLSAGYGYAGGEWADAPTFSLNFMHRLSRRSYLLSENYFISAGAENITLISIGGRTVWNKLSLDYGLWLPIYEEIDRFVGIPWLGLSLPLGKLRRGS